MEPRPGRIVWLSSELAWAPADTADRDQVIATMAPSTVVRCAAWTRSKGMDEVEQTCQEAATLQTFPSAMYH